MRFTTVPASSLDPTQIAAWADIQATDSILASPFFAPEFTLAVAAERPDISVAIIEDGRQSVGFFPHQRNRLALGGPVGGVLNDLQGIVARPQAHIDADDLIRGCRLAHWTFTRVIASQPAFARYHVRFDVSRFIDLSSGFDAYAKNKQASFAERLLRKGRKLEREAGPMRFEVHNGDPAVLAQLMAWKSVRYRDAGYVDVFQIPWARRLIQRIHQTRTARFGGLLSVLWAGDEIAAAHFGLRCLDRCHSWVVSYSPRFAHYSPGLLLYWKLAESATTIGVGRIEIGGGHYPYKQMISNNAIAVAAGSVDRLRLVTAARRRSEDAKDWIRASPLLRPPARIMLRTCRRMIRAALKSASAGSQNC